MGNKDTRINPYPHPYTKFLISPRFVWIVDHEQHLAYFQAQLNTGSLVKFITEYNHSIVTAKAMGVTGKLENKLKSFHNAFQILLREGFIEKTGIVWNSYDDYKIIHEGLIVEATKATPALVPTLPIGSIVAAQTPQIKVNIQHSTVTGTVARDYSLDIFVAEKLVRLHNSATRRNKEFNLTFAHLKRKLQRSSCAYTGVPFTYDNPDAPTYPTIDRIDSSKGYVIGNIVVCTNIANEWKNHVLEDSSSKLYMGYDHVTKMMSTLAKLKGN